MIRQRFRSDYWHPLALLFSIAIGLLASGCLWGVVQDASTGAPIGGASVTYTDSNGQTGTATTDANGIYYFDQTKGPLPAAGNVNFSVNAEGYGPLAETRLVQFNDSPSAIWEIQNFGLTPEPGWYHNETWGFSIKFPEDWVVEEGESEDEPPVIAIAPPENVNDEFLQAVMVGVMDDVPSGTTLEMFFQLNLRSLKASTPSFKQLEDGKATVNGVDARWATFSGKQGTQNFKCLVYMLLKGERGYLILGMDESAQFLDHKAELKAIAETFRID